MDEQLKSLKLDMDEEMQERQARIAANRKPPIDTGTAIIVAAIILVAGLWGGKVFYDHIQEQRAIAALQHFSQSLNSAMKESDRRTQQIKRENAIKNEQYAKQQIAKQEAERQTRLNNEAQRKQAARLLTPQCKFWRDQYESNPSERAANEYRKACNY